MQKAMKAFSYGMIGAFVAGLGCTATRARSACRASEQAAGPYLRLVEVAT